jgi:hypothetical protein
MAIDICPILIDIIKIETDINQIKNDLTQIIINICLIKNNIWVITHNHDPILCDRLIFIHNCAFLLRQIPGLIISLPTRAKTGTPSTQKQKNSQSGHPITVKNLS